MTKTNRAQPSLTAQRAQRGQRTTLIGIGVNIGLVLTKGLAGWLGNSYALIADAIESATDIATSALVWLGLRTAALAPDEKHPYGHGKAEPLASIIVSVALVGAALFIAIQSVQKISVPHPIPKPFTLVVLAIVILVKEILFRRITEVGEEVGSNAVKADAWHHRSDALTSLTAFVGISIALLGGPGYESADDWAALAASGLIIYNAWHIFRPAFGEIMDEAPAGNWAADIRAIAVQLPHVSDIEKCHVRKMGFEYFIDLHLLVDGDLTVDQGHAVAHQVKEAILREIPSVYDVLIHVEPA